MDKKMLKNFLIENNVNTEDAQKIEGKRVEN